MPEANPYAPPVAATAPTAVSPAAPGLDLVEALRRLDRHLADPQAVAADRHLARGGLRTVTIGWLIGTAAFALPAVVIGAVIPGGGIAAIIMGIIGGLCAAIAIAHLVQDLRFPVRETCTTPSRALDGWFRAQSQGRLGMLVAALAPTAREAETPAPVLPPVVTGPGSYRLQDAEGMKAWLGTFARQGHGQLHGMKAARITEVAREGRVARVAVDLRFTSWPVWANYVSLVLFLLIRLLGLIVALVLMAALRKSRKLTATFVLLEGTDGLWYVADPSFGDDIG